MLAEVARCQRMSRRDGQALCKPFACVLQALLLKTVCCIMQVMLHVDEQAMDSLCASLLQRKLYGLHPANVLVLPIPRFFGQTHDPSSSMALTACADVPARSVGSGFAMLSCGWPHFAYQCGPHA